MEDTMPLVSIIIPTFNSEEYISRAINSVLKQTLQNIEVIIVDDGSTDCTAAVIDNISDNRVQYIYKENAGAASARNTGIATARGRYIGFVDSDDFVSHKMYETLYNLAIRYDADIVNGSFFTINQKDAEILNFNHKKGYITIKDGRKLGRTANCDRSLWFVVKGIYRTSMIKENKLFFPSHLTLGEETPFVLDCFLKANKIVETDEKLYGYVQRPESMTHKRYRRGYFDKLNDLYDAKRIVYENNHFTGYENDLNQYTMEHTLPMLLSNELRSGKSFCEQRAEFKRIRKSQMITEAFRHSSTKLIKSRLRYMAILLKYRQFSICALLCK